MKSHLFSRASLKKDVAAGLTLSVESIPDGMAVGTLAAINPISGVYAYMVGGFSGAFFTSSVSLSIQATSAMALIVAGVPEVTSADSTAQDALFLLTLMTGGFMVLFGLLRLGSILRLVPDSVMSAFTHAVGLSIILGQLPTATGYDAEGGNKVMQAVDLLAHLGQIEPTALATGLIAVVIVVAMSGTRFKTLGILVAIFVASLVPSLLDWSAVALAGDVAEIPSQLPLPILPDWSSVPDLVPAMVGASLALAIVGLVQGAAVTHAYPDPDGSKPDPSGDFTGQGLANVPTAFLQGMPVGGSFSATAILVEGGARSRFGNIVAGLGIAVALLALRDAVGLLAMPALAGFLIVLGVGVLKPSEVASTWRLGGLDRWGMVLLIAIALLVSLQASVFVGVALAILIHIGRESRGIVVMQAVVERGEPLVERAVEPDLGPDPIVVLRSYGALFYASAERYEAQLPRPTDDTPPTVVILDLRGQEDLDPTTLNMLTEYATKLGEHDCRLVLAEVGATARATLERTATLDEIGDENVFAATDEVNASIHEASADAEQWLAARRTAHE